MTACRFDRLALRVAEVSRERDRALERLRAAEEMIARVRRLAKNMRDASEYGEYAAAADALEALLP